MSHTTLRMDLARQAKGRIVRLKGGSKWTLIAQCQYCTNFYRFKHLTIDHVVPKRDGGHRTADNIILACGLCNQARVPDFLKTQAKKTQVPKVIELWRARIVTDWVERAHQP